MDRLGAAGHVALYGLTGGVLIAALRVIEYRWLLVQHSVEIYGGVIAAVFAVVGLWLGRSLARRPPAATPGVATLAVATSAPPPPVAGGGSFVRDDARVAVLGLTRRELEILACIAEGLSNQEIGARLFVSENTVKTHASRVFDKLDARRRTQAVQRARELRLIP